MRRYPLGYRIKKVMIRFCWTKCELCLMEIKKEMMWKIYNHQNPYRDNDFFFCMGCCPDEESVMGQLSPYGEIIREMLDINNPPGRE